MPPSLADMPFSELYAATFTTFKFETYSYLLRTPPAG